MSHAPKKVLAMFVNGGNLIFDTTIACADYFTQMGHLLYPTQVSRLIDSAGLWQYIDENGNTVQVIFDELFTGEKEE